MRLQGIWAFLRVAYTSGLVPDRYHISKALQERCAFSTGKRSRLGCRARELQPMMSWNCKPRL